MKLLLDTHALIWWWLDDDRLPAATRQAIAATESLVSAVVVWEIVGKERVGRFPEATPVVSQLWRWLKRDRFGELPISLAHAQHAAAYPIAHADPFDRLLAAQAELDQLVLVTKDRAFADFPCATRW